ncbi:MAG: LysM peptidoglycan-binding domain-containing protein [Candidatus Eisenbacteria bacterium]
MTLSQSLRLVSVAALFCMGSLSGPVLATESPVVPMDSASIARASNARQNPLSPAATVGTAIGTPSTPADPDAALLDQPALDDIDLQMNADVLKWIGFFTGSGRSTFERWLKRSGRYMELFRGVLQKEGLPQDLVHLVFVESGFNMHAKSYAAAVGPWQFMLGTGKMFGLNVNRWVDERRDPEKSTVAAARYLKHLYGIFGDWPLALASYNAGEGTVLRAVKRQGTMNYWELKLPQQTEDYVPKFMAALAISRDPVKYGFADVEFDDPFAFDEVSLKGGVDLRGVAKLADCTVDDLKELNPAFRANAVRTASGIATLRVPRGKGEVIAQRLREGQRLPAVDLTVNHRVKRGETLKSIAAEYSVSARSLASANRISRRRPLKRGMLLTVPATMKSPSPEIFESDDPSHSTAYVPTRRIGLPAQIRGNSDNAVSRTVHTVKRGETISGIAKRYGVSTGQVCEWNKLGGSGIRRGMRLRIFGADAVAPTTTTENETKAGGAPTDEATMPAAQTVATTKVHEVRAGETLTGIALQYGVTLAELRSWNKVNKHGTVRKGQKLKIRLEGTGEIAATADSPADVDAVAKEPASPAKRAVRGSHGPRATTRMVTVRPGDTLEEIARRHGVSIQSLRKANRISGSHIRAGQKLKLRA